MKKLLLSIMLITLVTIGAKAQSVNNWKGILNMGNTKMDLYFKILDTNGKYTSTLSVPIQNLKDFPMDSTIYEHGNLRIVNNQLGMNYSGIFQKESNEFKGKFSQGGMSFDMNLTQVNGVEQRKFPQEPKAPYPYNEEDVEFVNSVEGNKLSGTLTYPKGEGKFPAVILISGSGSQDRNETILGHKPFLVIADYLTRNGIIVLRYDDRGVGGSEVPKNIASTTTENIAMDAQAALDFLKNRKDVSQVGVIGHSEGGTIAFILASKENTPDFIISMAGTGLKGSEILLKQQKDIYTIMGLSSDMINSNYEMNNKIYQMIDSTDKIDDNFRTEIINILSKSSLIPSNTPEKDLQNMANQVLSPWMRFFIKHNPMGNIEKITIPVLAINGTKDVQVSAKENLSAIEEGLKKAGNKNYQIVSMDGLNHLFQPCQTGLIQEYGTIETTIDPSVLLTIKDWIKKIN